MKDKGIWLEICSSFLCLHKIYSYHELNRFWSSSTILLLGIMLSSAASISFNLTTPSFSSRSPTIIIQGILDSLARSKCFDILLLTKYSAFTFAAHSSLANSAACVKSSPNTLTRTSVLVARVVCIIITIINKIWKNRSMSHTIQAC